MQLPDEAKLFGRYLVGRRPPAAVIQRYIAAVGSPTQLSSRDRRLLDYVHRHPWSLRCFDGGLALVRPQAELRRRLYILFALLESTPELAGALLPTARSPWYAVVVVGRSLRAGLAALVGLIALTVLRA